MLHKATKGNLVYIPAEVTLYKESQGATIKIMKLTSPANLLITSVNETTYEVFYESESWLVDKKKTYEVTQ